MAQYHEDLAAIGEWPENWDREGAKAIDKCLLAWALEWIESIASFLQRSGVTFADPHISANCEGEVTFEWWSDDRSVTVYLEAVGEAEAILCKGRGGNSPQRIDATVDMIDFDVSFFPNWYVMWTWIFLS